MKAMDIYTRIAGSIVFGSLLAGLLVALAWYLNDQRWSSILVWHWRPIYSLAGNGPLLGYKADGSPMYEGTPVHLVFGFVGYFAGFIIYPIAIFLIWTLVDRFRRKKNNQEK